MKSHWEKIVEAAENLFDVLEQEKIDAYEKSKNTPDHSKEFYIALQDLRKRVSEFRKMTRRERRK